MDKEKLVELVTAEVIRQLGHQAKLAIQDNQTLPKILAVFTGGTIGLENGLAQLQYLQASAEVIVALSPAAEQVAGIARLREKLGADIQIITAQSPYPGELLQDIELLVIPVLTQNTAAKLAYTLADTFVTTLIMQALLQGKPVLAVPDAADPHNEKRAQYQTAKPAPTLVSALHGNLKKIETFGITFVSARQLAAEAKRRIQQQDKADIPPAIIKSVIDAEAVRLAAKSGAKTFTVTQGNIITPLARDVARDCHIEFVVGAC